MLELLENNAVAVWLRESPSVFAYPTVLAFHTVGMAFLVGCSAGIALRTLGFAPGLPIAPLEKFFRVLWIGFGVNLVSGLVLLGIDAHTFLTMPDFYIKLLAIAVAMVSIRLLRPQLFGNPARLDTSPVPMKGKILAVVVLTAWLVAITAGRVTAYEAFIGRQTAVAVLLVAVVMLAGGYAAFRVWKKPAPHVRVATSTDF